MWTDLGHSTQLSLNAAICLQAKGRRVLLVRTTSALYAMEDKCPHQEQTFAGGVVHDNSIECPWHSVTIELSSGKILNTMGFLGMPNVRVFPVKEESGKILVEFPDDLPSYLPAS